MKPAFKILADGADVTATMADRLLSLSVTDEDGETADRLEIELDDRDGRIALPEIDAELTVSLGFAGRGLTPMGTFAVEGLSGRTPPQTLRITATAVDLKATARAPRSRAFEDKTLSEIVTQIAGDAGLSPVVGASIRDTRWAYLAQTAESDLHFLTRIARQIDATAKAANGRLIVVRRAEGTTAEGEPLPPVSVPVTALARWSWTLKSREVDGTVEAEWADTDAGETRRVSAGNAAPVRRLRQIFGSEDEATRAAQARLRAAKREALNFDAAGAFQPGLFAGGLLRVPGLRPEFDGDWVLTRVVHTLNGSGLSTQFSAKREFEP
jgi:hypothetical protein